MRYLLSIALLTSFVGCKNDETTGDLKTLDQLAGSKKVYTCQTEDKANYPSAELVQRIVIGNTKCDAKAMSSDCKEVAKAVATVPKEFQDAFLELGGSIKVGGDTDQICGVTLKKAEVVGEEKISGIASCWAIAASDRDQDNSPSKVVVIAHKNLTSAKQYTTRVFGYFASQALPYVNPDGAGYKFDFNNIANKNIAAELTKNKVSVMNKFVREIKKSKYSLTSMEPVLGVALNYVKLSDNINPETDAIDQPVRNRVLAFSDYVSADAFDSMFCGEASTNKKLKKANKTFESTIEDYRTKVHPALQQLAKSIAGNGMNLTTTAGSADLAALLQILGIGAAVLKSMPNPALQVAASSDTSLANNTTVGSCTCGSCQGCANGNCSCANGSCCAEGCCGPNCQCGGTCANCGTV